MKTNFFGGAAAVAAATNLNTFIKFNPKFCFLLHFSGRGQTCA